MNASFKYSDVTKKATGSGGFKYLNIIISSGLHHNHAFGIGINQLTGIKIGLDENGSLQYR